jgi:hypothetical protein
LCLGTQVLVYYAERSISWVNRNRFNTIKYGLRQLNLHVFGYSQIKVEKDFIAFLLEMGLRLPFSIYFFNNFIQRFSHTVFFPDIKIRLFALFNYRKGLRCNIELTYSRFKVIVMFLWVSIERLKAQSTFKLFY